MQVTSEDVAEVVAKWTGIPVARLLEGEVEKLIHMEERLHERVVGQDEAVSAVSSSSSDWSRSFEAGSLSFLSASRSISSWRMRRSTSSSSAGIESISIRSFEAASSTRSIALSGRKRSEM